MFGFWQIVSLSNWMLVTGISTATLQVAFTSAPLNGDTVMIASPYFFAVNTPFLSTVTTSGVSETYFIGTAPIESGVVVIINCCVLPGFIETNVKSNLTASGHCTQFTLHSAVFDPSSVVTVMVASPALIAVIKPFSETVTISSFEDFQLTTVFVGLAGINVGFNV